MIGIIFLFYFFLNLMYLRMFYSPLFRNLFFFFVLLLLISHSRQIKNIVKKFLLLLEADENPQKKIKTVDMKELEELIAK